MRIYSLTLLALMIWMGLSTGCKQNGNGSDQDSTASDSLVDPSLECEGLKAKQFCWEGLDFIRIGDSLTWKTYAPPVGGVFKDTVFSDTVMAESGAQITDWNVRLLRFASGVVFLESDFDTGHLLNRLRVETPEYSLKNGLRVGSTAAEVFNAYGAASLKVLPFEEYGVMEVIRNLLIGDTGRTLTFHIPLGPWYKPGLPAYDQSSIPADAKVSRIVVM
jgi:hypothetical protein